MEYEREIEVQAPPEAVWSVLSDVERWPEWHPSVTEARLLGAGPLGVGTEVLLRQPRLPAARWTVDDCRPGRGFAWTSRAPGVTSRGLHEVTAAAGGSHVRLRLVQTGPLSPVAGALYGRLTRAYLRQEAEGIKRRAERLRQG